MQFTTKANKMRVSVYELNNAIQNLPDIKEYALDDRHVEATFFDDNGNVDDTKTILMAFKKNKERDGWDLFWPSVNVSPI